LYNNTYALLLFDKQLAIVHGWCVPTLKRCTDYKTIDEFDLKSRKLFRYPTANNLICTCHKPCYLAK